MRVGKENKKTLLVLFEANGKRKSQTIEVNDPDFPESWLMLQATNMKEVVSY